MHIYDNIIRLNSNNIHVYKLLHFLYRPWGGGGGGGGGNTA